MKIVISDIKDEDGKPLPDRIFSDAEDVYVAVRSVQVHIKDDSIVHVLHTTSHSLGPAIRELLKELRQSIVEMEYKRKEMHDADSQ